MLSGLGSLYESSACVRRSSIKYNNKNNTNTDNDNNSDAEQAPSHDKRDITQKIGENTRYFFFNQLLKAT